VSVESDPAMAAQARRHLREAGLDQTVEVVCGDALRYLADLEGPVDMVFTDIEKQDYLAVLIHCRRILRPGGLLVADNTAFTDAQPFNQALCGDPLFRSVNLLAFLPGHSPARDGLALAVRMPIG
jgi:predicted O-methyltransferase YrrM